MKPKLYKPTRFSIAVMAVGFAVIVFLKVRKNGVQVAGWMDWAFYLVAPIAAGLIANMLFARIWIGDDRIEIVGLLSRKSYPLRDITEVRTEKGADVKFKLRGGRWVSLPSWLGAEGWGVAAALRRRLGDEGESAERPAPASSSEA